MILGLLVRYGTDRYPEGTDDGIAAIARFAGTRPFEVVIVDNARRRRGAQQLAAHVSVERGDNRVREFTAWDAALARHLPRLRPDDVVVLVTDALRQGDSDHLDDISPDAVGLVAEWPVAYGHRDAIGSPLMLDGVGVQHWLRSSFVAVSARTLRLVTPLAAVSPAELFTSRSERGFGPRVSGGYADFLTGWLLGAETESGTTYHAGTRQRSVGDFQVKCACVANEHLLSARLERSGVRLVDMTRWRHAAAGGRSGPGCTNGPWTLTA